MVAIIQDLVVFNQHFYHSILSCHLVLLHSKEVKLILPTKPISYLRRGLEGNSNLATSPGAEDEQRDIKGAH